MSDRVWDLFVELRKELVESQRLRAQAIGFKITFVSTAVGLIATKVSDVDATLLVVPAFASVFFDFLINGYSFSIKRIGLYTRQHIEPALRENGEVPRDFLLWQDYLSQPKTRQRLALYGNVGFTLMMVVIGGVSLFLPFRPALSLPLLGALLVFFIMAVAAHLAPGKLGKLWRTRDYGASIVALAMLLTLAGAPQGLAADECLPRALEKESLERVQRCLAKGSDPNQPIWSEMGGTARTALSVGIELGREDIVVKLLDAGADPNLLFRGTAPLISAAGKGLVEITKILLDAGADPNLQTQARISPLHAAAVKGRHEIIRILLEGGADVEAEGRYGSAVHAALTWRPSSVPRKRSAEEIRRDRWLTVRQLLNGGADATSQDERGRSPLMLAASLGDTECVRLLVGAGADLGLRDDRERTALFHAVANGKLATTELLLEMGADPSARDASGRTVLMAAIDWGDVTPLWDAEREKMRQIVGHLLSRGVDVSARDRAGTSAADIAARRGYRRIFDRLISVEGNTDTSKRQDSRQQLEVTLLDQRLIAATQAGDVEAMTEALEAGAHLEARSHRGPTPLMLAARERHVDAVNLLLERGADPLSTSVSGSTALHAAASVLGSDPRTDEAVKIVRRLLAAGVEPDGVRDGGFTALFMASRDGAVEVVRTLLEAGADPDQVTDGGLTPLMAAAFGGHVEVVEVLLKKHADVEVVDVRGQTALMFAASASFEESSARRIVEMLLKTGADLDRRDDLGETALMRAVEGNHKSIVRLLLRRGADPAVQDVEGKTAADRARALGLAPERLGLVDNGA